ncbi:MAG: hypothetical protein AAF682_31225 [Planctomycetota bacterium]
MTDFFATLLQKIQDHATYGPAMRAAVDADRVLALNYHSHGDPGSWCVSICALQRDPTRLLQIGVPELEELVHIRGIGKSAEECIPFCSAFADVLREHYRLTEPPRPFLNGQPVSAETG